MLTRFFFLSSVLLVLTGCLPAKAGGDDKAIATRKYTYGTLSPYQKQLFDDFLSDENPAEKKAPKATSIELDISTPNALKRTQTEKVESAVFEKDQEISEPCPNDIKVVYNVPVGWSAQPPSVVLTPNQ